MSDTFSDTDKQTTGIYANDYLWSDLKNWSTGKLPVSTTAVTVNSTVAAPSVADVALTVASLTLGSSSSLIVANTLTTSSLGSAAGGTALAIDSGGTLEVTSSLKSLETFTLDGGTLDLDASVALISGSSFTFGSTATYGTSALNLADPANFNMYNSFATPFNSFDVGDSVQFGTLNFVSARASGNTVFLTGAAGAPSYTLSNFKTTVASPTFSLSTAPNGGTIMTLNCFLAGTRIETQSGPVAIETLSVGDIVVTIEHGARVLKPVRWIGARAVDPGAMDEAVAQEAAPVRIRAHAFAENVPLRDLLVTPDHCIFEAGGLIPARMLVNGASIVRETDGSPYRVYHMKCETHSILISEGLTTESYLDTGARGGFGLPDAGPRHDACWLKDAAAPLVTARAKVEPVWRRLAARAEALGMGRTCESRITRTTPDPALRLVFDDGTSLRARRCRGDRHFFVLPIGTMRATLRSRSAVPADVEGMFVDDRRRLGVLVRRLTLWTELRGTVLEAGGGGVAGWHEPEAPADSRWTDGQAGLEWPMLLQPTMLEIELAGTLRYPAPEEVPQRLQA